MPFIQVIEYTTSRWDEMEALVLQYHKDTEGRRTSGTTRVCVDRDRPNRYVAVVEFPSYEAAMENNNLEETAALAEAVIALCDEPPVFHNLDVARVMD
ncbi:MAG TPA: hypothetical protein VL337_17330 [Acidimicrobiales bacterium]|jgi:hypothetical protein|nr:hypothetical protein [Acidimicrobiales bacterium]